jgi:undecaprenyl-diphosphatase
MDTLHAIALALLQGLTEFLPISSSAHLILMPVLFHWPDQGLAFDVAVHVGTLSAVVAYYRVELVVMARDWLLSVSGKEGTEESRLAWYVILGTIPVGLAGISMNGAVENALRSPLIIAASTIVFALVLWWAEKVGTEQRSQCDIGWKEALGVGIFQALALIPGTSRSGITITAGLLLGFKRELAARFSFLLSIPVIALAGLMKTRDLMQSPDSVPWSAMGIGALVSAVTAYLTIGWFLKLLDRVGLMPFVIYRLFLGVVLFAVFLKVG